MGDRAGGQDAKTARRPKATELPDWIADPVLLPAWRRIRDRFEQAGLEPKGNVVVDTSLRAERHAVGALLGATLTRSSVRVDLESLDARLIQRSGVGGLAAVLAGLFGSAPHDRPAARAAQLEARERPLRLAAEMVDRPWAPEWVAGLRRTGLLTGRLDAEQVIRDAAAVLSVISAPEPPRARSRVELAAEILGDAHALDRDRPTHQVVLRGLAAAAAVPVPESAWEREALWGRFGVEPDLLSRTALVWGLLGLGDVGIASRMAAATEAGDPVHLTRWDLRRLDGFVSTPRRRVLVCENPRVLEAIAEWAIDRGGITDCAVVCTSGEPNLVVDELLGRLAETRLPLSYHGDFDWPGVGIANRVSSRYGAVVWRMTADDYLSGVRSEGPGLVGTPIEPSWDAELGAAMRLHGRAVHEEAVLPGLLDGLGRGGGSM